MNAKTYRKKANKASKSISPSVKKYVKSTVKKALTTNAETKFSDQALGATNLSYNTAGTIVDLTSMGQGITSTSRVGDQVRGKYFDIRVNCYALRTSSAVADPVNTVRFIIVKWHEDSFLIPPTIPLIMQYNAIGSVTDSLLSPFSISSTERGFFTVVHDSMHQVVQTAGFNFYKRINLHNSIVKYGVSASTGPDHYFSFFIADDGGVIAPCPVVSMFTRFAYTDA